MGIKETAKIAALILIIVFPFYACDHGDQPCVHNWEWMITTVATCEATGIEIERCTECSETRGDPRPIDKLPHNFKNGKCTECDYEDPSYASCTNGHTLGTPQITPATCTESGKTDIFCTVCQTLISSVPIAALEHTPGTPQITPATCTESGKTDIFCTVCQSLISSVPINPLGHDWNEWIQTVAPTCTTEGMESRNCNRNCGISDETKSIAVLGHNMAIGQYICPICNKPAKTGEIGPGGGTIFFVSEIGFTMFNRSNPTYHYLEIGPTLGYKQWSTTNRNISGMAATDRIGVGKHNTDRILVLDPTAPAALACVNYSGNGKTDWFLPNLYEVGEYYRYIYSRHGLVAEASYWSSSQVSSGSAKSFVFHKTAGHMEKWFEKSSYFLVRPVRAF